MGHREAGERLLSGEMNKVVNEPSESGDSPARPVIAARDRLGCRPGLELSRNVLPVPAYLLNPPLFLQGSALGPPPPGGLPDFSLWPYPTALALASLSSSLPCELPKDRERLPVGSSTQLVAWRSRPQALESQPVPAGVARGSPALGCTGPC